MNSQALYDKAFRSYLLTKYISAANTCNKAILAIKQEDEESLKVNIWTLYLNIASTLLVSGSSLPPAKLFGLEETHSVQDVCRSIWNKLVQAYQPMETMNPKLVSACLVLDLKLNQFTEAREVAESWFACLSDLVLDDIANGRQSDEIYIEMVQLYTCRILPAMNDFESAITFLEYNSVLTDSKKKVLKSIIQEQKDTIEKELIQKKKLEELAAIEAAEKLAAEEKAIAAEKEAAVAAAAAAAEAKAAEKEKEEEKIKLAEKEENDRQKGMKQQEEIRTVTSRSINPPSVLDHNVSLVKKWMGQVTAKSAASYATILIIVFALLALLRGQRGRLSIALQTLMAKLWQTIKMGTKVTYM